MEIKSIPEIVAFLRRQAELRSPENDERTILLDAADEISDTWLETDAGGG